MTAIFTSSSPLRRGAKRQPYQHDAIALTDCEICAIPVSVIERLGHEQPALYLELMAR